ncbi:hypothetical protein CAPTEDRAFT_204943 [Capitella teleta]|uniref:Uncharacterized protein n=1 Tax=Capitella teleta TaxID=283909 RepID=R7UR99_CAPTE|nr:hypothetical protein CAPTEDRAFT_204943 [Capitella teleta]|eukprot:ELU08638.1 hypothetical protein CAPTEDRAFT_204943 [Capitella teleta]
MRSALRKIFDERKMQSAIPTRIGGTKWINHFLKALNTMFKAHSAILQHLQNLQDEKADQAQKARGMTRWLRDEQLITFALFMRDILQFLVKISLIAQRSTSTVAEVYGVMKSVTTAIATFETRPTPGEKQVQNHMLLKEELNPRASIIWRFEDSDLLKATHILSLKAWPTATEDLAAFGEDEVILLSRHFETTLCSAGFECSSIPVEWCLLKGWGTKF